MHDKAVERLLIDYLGPFSPRRSIETSVFLFIEADYFSRLAIARAIPNATTDITYNFLCKDVASCLVPPIQARLPIQSRPINSDPGTESLSGKGFLSSLLQKGQSRT